MAAGPAAAAARVPAGLFAALPAGAGTEMDYTARRDAGKPAAARGSYRVAEDDGMDLRGPRKSDPVVHLRRILVYSSANAAGQARARALKLAQAAGELDKLVRTAGTRFHPDAGAVAARPGARRQTPGREVPAHRHHRRPGRQTCPGLALRPGCDRRRSRRGRLVRAADQPGAQDRPAGSSAATRASTSLNAATANSKGPLAVAPIFLELNRRITALITVICLALLIFCLVERQVRQALAPHAEMMTGLPGYGPAPARPTGRTIFRALADLRLIPAHDGNPATIPKPAGVQARLLDLLNIDISRARWLTP